MDSTIITATISALTALVVSVAAHIGRLLHEKRKETKEVRNKYLNPLRLYLEENYFRISEILHQVKVEGNCVILLYVDSPDEVSRKDASWFNDEGCYLISTCYFTACLFAFIKKVREDVPYLSLRGRDDTKLLNLLFKVSHSFLQDLGIYYAIQHSIGEQTYMRDEGRCMTYQEFCMALQEPAQRVWFDRLLTFYIDTAQGKSIGRLKAAVATIYDVSKFLDKRVGGGPSIRERLLSEGVEYLPEE